jgi:hypothetical protein
MIRKVLAQVAAALAGAAIGVCGSILLVQPVFSEPNTLLATKEHDRHAIIAITCPYAPYFSLGDDRGTEWRLIASALERAGRDPQSLYVTYEEGISYAKSRYVTGVWVCGGMHPPENGFFPSMPLLQRNFVVATLAANETTVDDLMALASMAVAIHPNVFRVLAPQLKPLESANYDFQQIGNHTLLASLLLTGKIDALVTEKSVFGESLKCIPEEAGPDQAVVFHEIFAPVSPRILFTDRDLRDQFDAAWQELTGDDKG